MCYFYGNLLLLWFTRFLGKLFYLKMLIAQKFWQIFCLLKLHQIWWLLNENICHYLCDRSILRRTDGRGGRTEETAISILPPPQLTTILLFWETVIVRHCPHLTNCPHTSSASHWWAGTCVTTQDSPVYIQSSICIVRFTFLLPLFSARTPSLPATRLLMASIGFNNRGFGRRLDKGCWELPAQWEQTYHKLALGSHLSNSKFMSTLSAHCKIKAFWGARMLRTLSNYIVWKHTSMTSANFVSRLSVQISLLFSVRPETDDQPNPTNVTWKAN